LEEPTTEQLVQMFRLTYLLTGYGQFVSLVTIDDRDGRLIILSGREIDIAIDKQGKVNYERTEFQNNE
jgi:hypothetical protein